MNEMQESTEATGSAAPSPQSWIDAFEQADIIFAITISSKLSGSWQSLISAKDMYLEDHPDKRFCDRQQDGWFRACNTRFKTR